MDSSRAGYSSIFSEESRLSFLKRKKHLILLVLLVIVIIVCVTLIVYYATHKGKSGGNDGPNCLGIDGSKRYNCFPGREPTEKECVDKGCCYDPGKKGMSSEVPKCFFPSNYVGYKVDSIDKKKLPDHIEAHLVKGTASGFPKDVQNLLLQIDLIDDNSLRIRITDSSDNNRFQVPLPVNAIPKKKNHQVYDVDVKPDGELVIYRKSTKTIVFKTQLSQLVYSNQFLQLSTETSSKFLYGLSEHMEGILKSFDWKRWTIFNQGDLPTPDRNLYGTHPFYLVMEPSDSGVTANGLLLYNSNAMDIILQPTPAATLRTVGGVLDLFVMLGTSPEHVIQIYTGIVGRPFMPPYWSLGFHLCRYGNFYLSVTNETLQRNLDIGIPVEVQWNDIDYMDHFNDFTYDHKNFSGLPEFVNDLHNKGMHYVAMISPGVSNSEEEANPPYDEGKQLDLFVKDHEGKSYIEGKVWNRNWTVFPDFSNPATPSYWARQFERFYKELEFDGIWIDMNEPLNFLNGSSNGCPESDFEDPPYLPGGVFPLRTMTLCMTARHNSTIHYNEHNLLSIREAMATYNALKNITNKRPFIISRATFVGQGAYSGHWSGDIASLWEDMRYTIPSMLSFNMYGMPMIGSDICGFRLNTTEELCARWHALGAFYPFSRNHNDIDTVLQDPASMGETVIKSAKDNLNIRYYLLPYLYTLFHLSHVNGDTVVRPIFFEFPKDVKTFDIEEQFMWGSALMIVPILYENTSTVDAYFPQGLWYDFLSREMRKSSGQTFSLDINITSISLSVRGGSILPCQKPNMTTADSRKNDFDLFVALDEKKEALGELYWDDGDSLGTYEDGKYNFITFSSKNNMLNSTIWKKEYNSSMILGRVTVCGIDEEPKEVTINGNNVTLVLYEKPCFDADVEGQYTLLEPITFEWKF